MCFTPERNNRYAYFLDSAGTPLQNRATTQIVTTTADIGVDLDAFKYGPSADVSAYAAGCASSGNAGAGILSAGATPLSWSGIARGNIDADTTIDVWRSRPTAASSPRQPLRSAAMAPRAPAASRPTT